ncbi:MAG: hypothetical protein AAF183_10735 [Pseudomonadota bacterium]
MGADPLSNFKSAVGKFEACSRPEMDRLRMMCNDYKNIKEKGAKERLGKDIQSSINSRILKCSKTFDADVTKATKDLKSLPPEFKKEFDKATKHIKGLPGNKSCLKLEVATKGTTMTIKPSFMK